MHASRPICVSIEGVSKVFPGTMADDILALKDIDLDIYRGEFVCLLGPSGCGKSTLLNAIAGFSLPTCGSIKIDDRTVAQPGPDRGMVFQEYALFPWMTVEQNVRFGLQIKGIGRTESAAIVESLLRKLGLWGFRSRYPKDLSGGMRQRTAIARILAVNPPILLMDEPFGALDALTKRNLQDELLRLWMELGKTVIFVTHSIEEALYLADRIVAMTFRPGTIKREITVDIPRPRDPAAPMFNNLKRELTEWSWKSSSASAKPKHWCRGGGVTAFSPGVRIRLSPASCRRRWPVSIRYA